MPFCGLDVSLRTTSLCIVDQDGRVLREAKLPSDPMAIAEFLDGCGLRCERIGLESGSTSSWLCAGLRGLGHAVICIEARHAAAALQAGPRNKTDRNDARRLAERDAAQRLSRDLAQITREPSARPALDRTRYSAGPTRGA